MALLTLNAAILNIGVTAMQNAATYLSLHTAQPDATGSNQTTHARVATSWGAAANGSFANLTNKAFTGGAASGAVTYVGLWSASTAGTFYGYFALSGDQASNSNGEYTLTSAAITGSSS